MAGVHSQCRLVDHLAAPGGNDGRAQDTSAAGAAEGPVRTGDQPDEPARFTRCHRPIHFAHRQKRDTCPAFAPGLLGFGQGRAHSARPAADNDEVVFHSDQALSTKLAFPAIPRWWNEMDR
jgi:hypothetical protein